MEENFKKSIDSIKPDDGARDRMLRRIKKKAAEPEKKTFSANRMASTFGLAAVACLVVILAFNMGRLMESVKPKPQPTSGPEVTGSVSATEAPTSAPTAEPTTEPTPTVAPDIVGPSLVYFDSLEELANQLSINIALPEGLQYLKYSLVNGDTAQVLFSYKDIGYAFLIKKENVPKLIESDDYCNFYTFEAKVDYGQVIVFDYNDGTSINHYGEVYWLIGDIAYVVRTYDYIQKEDLEEIANLLVNAN